MCKSSTSNTEWQLVVADPQPKILAKRLASGIYRYGEDGLEKRCGRCREYWPADSEFFHANRVQPDGLTGNCKACTQEIRASKEERFLSTKQ